MLGAVMLNALQGNVNDPTASTVEPDTFISTGSVSLFDVPWMVKTPLTDTCATVRCSTLATQHMDSVEAAQHARGELDRCRKLECG